MKTCLLTIQLLLFSTFSYGGTTFSNLQNEGIGNFENISSITRSIASVNEGCYKKMQYSGGDIAGNLRSCRLITNEFAAACVESVPLAGSIQDNTEACANIDNEYALSCVKTIPMAGSISFNILACSEIVTKRAAECIRYMPLAGHIEGNIRNCIE